MRVDIRHAHSGMWCRRVSGRLSRLRGRRRRLMSFDDNRLKFPPPSCGVLLGCRLNIGGALSCRKFQNTKKGQQKFSKRSAVTSTASKGTSNREQDSSEVAISRFQQCLASLPIFLSFVSSYVVSWYGAHFGCVTLVYEWCFSRQEAGNSFERRDRKSFKILCPISWTFIHVVRP